MKAAAGLVVAALLLAPVPADAGELSRHSAPPIRGLEPCHSGGFTLPGSSTCLHLGGDIEAVSTVLGPHRPTAPARRLSLQNGVHTRLTLDARVPTELGPVRVYTSVRAGTVVPPDVLRR